MGTSRRSPLVTLFGATACQSFFSSNFWTLAFELVLLSLCSAGSDEPEGYAEVGSGRAFAVAMANPNVSTVVLTSAITVQDADWEGLGELPINLEQNVTVKGAAELLARGDLPTLDCNFVKAKLRLAGGAVLTLRELVLTRHRDDMPSSAPGLDLLADTWNTTGPPALLITYRAAITGPLCVPAGNWSRQSISATLRPDALPGTQQAALDLPQLGCINDSSAPWCSRCYPARRTYIDIAAYGAAMGPSGRFERTGYLVHCLETDLLCTSVMSLECTNTLGPLGCFYSVFPKRRAQPAVPPAHAAALSVADIAGGGGSDGGDRSTSHLAVVLAAPLCASVTVAIAIIAGVLVMRRLRHRQQEAQSKSQPRPALAVWLQCFGFQGHSATPGNSVSGARPQEAPSGISASATASTATEARKGHQRRREHPGCVDVAPGIPGCQESRHLSVMCSCPDKDMMETDEEREERAHDMTASHKAREQVKGCAAAGPLPPKGGLSYPGSFFGGMGPEDALQQQQQQQQQAELAVSLAPPVTPHTPPRPDMRLLTDLQQYAADDEVKLLPNATRGIGSYGRVVEGNYRGQRVAVKLVAEAYQWAGPSESLLRSFAQEVEVLCRCQHPNVVRLLAACLTPPRVCLVMELMEASLEHVLYARRRERRPLPLTTILHVGLEISKGLEYLHPTIVHRDLKPANVLLNNAEDIRPVVKLTDFGLSRLRTTEAPTLTPGAGTPAYLAPEGLNPVRNVITHKADIYSLAVLLWEMLAGERPWRDCNMMQLAVRIMLEGSRPPLEDIPESRCPPKLRALIASCWKTDPRRRPAAAEVVKSLVLIQQELLASGGSCGDDPGGPDSLGSLAQNVPRSFSEGCGPSACTSPSPVGADAGDYDGRRARVLELKASDAATFTSHATDAIGRVAPETIQLSSQQISLMAAHTGAVAAPAADAAGQWPASYMDPALRRCGLPVINNAAVRPGGTPGLGCAAGVAAPPVATRPTGVAGERSERPMARKYIADAQLMSTAGNRSPLAYAETSAIMWSSALLRGVDDTEEDGLLQFVNMVQRSFAGDM